MALDLSSIDCDRVGDAGNRPRSHPLSGHHRAFAAAGAQAAGTLDGFRRGCSGGGRGGNRTGLEPGNDGGEFLGQESVLIFEEHWGSFLVRASAVRVSAFGCVSINYQRMTRNYDPAKYTDDDVYAVMDHRSGQF